MGLNRKMKRAIILLSGGLDSAVTCAIAKNQGYDEIFALSFLYEQTHRRELDSAKKLGEYFSVKEHKILNIPLNEITESALVNGKKDVPIGKSFDEIKKGGNIPVTYVPGRNIIFLSYGLPYAEKVGSETIFIGANAVDYSNYPDCRPEFIKNFQMAADSGTKRGVEGNGVKIVAPLIDMKKSEIISKGERLGVPFELTWSCYKGGDKACGLCESCIIRLNGFSHAGLEDPVEYEF